MSVSLELTEEVQTSINNLHMTISIKESEENSYSELFQCKLNLFHVKNKIKQRFGKLLIIHS